MEEDLEVEHHFGWNLVSCLQEMLLACSRVPEYGLWMRLHKRGAWFLFLTPCFPPNKEENSQGYESNTTDNPDGDSCFGSSGQ